LIEDETDQVVAKVAAVKPIWELPSRLSHKKLLQKCSTIRAPKILA